MFIKEYLALKINESLILNWGLRGCIKYDQVEIERHIKSAVGILSIRQYIIPRALMGNYNNNITSVEHEHEMMMIGCDITSYNLPFTKYIFSK
jgi:hypothetical protein